MIAGYASFLAGLFTQTTSFPGLFHKVNCIATWLNVVSCTKRPNPAEARSQAESDALAVASCSRSTGQYS